MAFILDGLESESYDRVYSDGALIRRIVSFFAPHRKSILIVAVVLTLSSMAEAVAPIVVARAIDAIAGRPTLRYIVGAALAVFLVGAFAWVLNYARQKITARVVGDVVLTLRTDVFRHAVMHDMTFFDEHPLGRIVSRVTSDTQDFSNTVALVIDLLSQLLMVVILTAYLFTINGPLTVILLAMAPGAVVIALAFRRLARKVTLNAKRATAAINGHMQESISGISVAKTFRQEERLFQDFTGNNRQAYRVGLRRGLVLNLIFPVVSIAAGVGTGAMVFLGALAVETAPAQLQQALPFLAGARQMSPGEWYLFLQAVGFFWWPMLGIASFYSQFQDGLAAAERVFALIDAEPSVRQSGSDAPPLSGTVSFENVTFAYSAKETVLNDFSLQIDAGTTVALVGHTGAGKSSIARLITRFYEFQQGRICVDGADIRSLDLGAYRRQIGIVPQVPFLFNGTVGENIRYGVPGATDDQVLYAASHVGRGDWLEDLPNGLETEAGERGNGISMGQRQLVALARILLKDPALFILDEATASVDPFTEAQIQEGLETVMAGRTALVIAHRLSTIVNANRIVVLDRGRIIEDGTHGELLHRGGHYAELYNTYFRHQSLEYLEGKHPLG